MSLCSLLLIGWPDSGSSLILFLLADHILVENKTRMISDWLLSSEGVACTVFLLGMLIIEVRALQFASYQLHCCWPWSDLQFLASLICLS
uniref:Uncharacterized protein n=1 Tax=Ixodes ricinus TaxID=34613 RepID=A0A147BNF0_IXORI